MEETKEMLSKNEIAFKRPHWFWLIPLVIAILFDQMVWKKTPGLFFFLVMLLILVGGFILALIEKKKVPWQSWLLLLPILFGAVMTVFRLEGFTNFSNVILTLYALFLLAVTFLNGEWARYRLIDTVTSFFKMLLSLMIDPVRLVISQVKGAKQKSAGERKTILTQVHTLPGWHAHYATPGVDPRCIARPGRPDLLRESAWHF